MSLVASSSSVTNVTLLDHLFRPRSVAVVGASTSREGVGRQILDNLLDFGYSGRVFAVNPKVHEIGGLPCYPAVSAIGEAPELAVVVVPRAVVLPVVEECIACGVQGLVVITAGFRELDREGAALEEQLRGRAAEAGVPLLGPNCMGLFNTDPSLRLNLTFSPVPPRPGHIAFLSQSGALGALVLSLTHGRPLGYSLFASLGNEAGVTHLDALAYAGADERTWVIALYLETFLRPEDFLRVARGVAEVKPVVCLKGGRSETGVRAASSHTGALATFSRAFEALLRQAGMILAENTEELLNIAQGFAQGPLPRGRRVRVLTNAGGPGVLAADLLERHGLQLPQLAAERQAQLRSFVAPRASLGNPVDLTVEGTPAMYNSAARLLLADGATDALLAVFVQPPHVSGADVLLAVEQAAGTAERPVVAAFPAQEDLLRKSCVDKCVLVDFPEAAAPVLSAMARYAEWRSLPRGRVPRFAVRQEQVARLIEHLRRVGRHVLDVEESLAVVRAYGIPVARHVLVREERELDAGARRVGFPVALKVVSADVLHKTEVGGVVLGIRSQAELEAAYRALMRRLAAVRPAGRVPGVLLQQMVPRDRELILGFRRDEQGLPVVLARLGGILAEALEAVVLRVLPVTDYDVRAMLAEMPGGRVLGAFRGWEPVALPTVEESLLRLAQLASDFPMISEVDLNPFMASSHPAACQAVDARIVLAA